MTHPLAGLTLEEVFTGQLLADIPASSLQRAICRGAAGELAADLLSRDEHELYFGAPGLPGVVPTLVVLVAGVRGGKSFLAACAAIVGCLRADCDGLKSYEMPRFVILAPRVDVGTATFNILIGILRGSPILKRLLVGDPTTDTVRLRRPDGRLVEIVVAAASKGGITVRNRWLAGFVLEEVASFGAEDSGAAVNAEDLLRAAETRLLPGAQGWLISSPMGPEGLLFDLYEKYFGAPGRVLVCHAPTRALNPSFPQEKIDAIAADDPDTADREYYAKWIDAVTAFLSSAMVDRAVRKGPADAPRERGLVYAGAMDPATRGNAWTFLAYAGRPMPGKPGQLRHAVAAAREWKGSKAAPLSSEKVLREIAALCAVYGIDHVRTDQYAYDTLQEVAARCGVNLLLETMSAASKLTIFTQMRDKFIADECEIPDAKALRTDLVGVRKKVTPNGVVILLPKTPDGRHCDYAASYSLSFAHPLYEPEADVDQVSEAAKLKRAHCAESKQKWWERRTR